MSEKLDDSGGECTVKKTPKKRRPQRLTWDLETSPGVRRFLEVLVRRHLKGNINHRTFDACVSAARLALQSIQGAKIKKLPPTPAAEAALTTLRGGDDVAS